MGHYQLKSCCICFDTKSGSLLIAIHNLIVCLLLIWGACFGKLNHVISLATHQFVNSVGKEDFQQGNFYAYVCMAVLAHYALHGIFSSIFIHGVRQDRPGLMLPYLALHGLGIVKTLFLIISEVVILVAHDGPNAEISSEIHNYYIKMGIKIPAIIIATIVSIYFQLVMNSYYMELKRALSEDRAILVEESNNDEIYHEDTEKSGKQENYTKNILQTQQIKFMKNIK